MDSLAMFIFLFAVLALLLVWLCKFLFTKYMEKNKDGNASSSRQNSVAPAGVKNENLRLSEPKDVLSSKADLKELVAKPAGGRGRAAGPGSSGSLRKRMVRQSSTGPENRRKRFVPPPSNVVGPESTSVTWTSQVFRWLYSDLVIVNELLISWVIAINDKLQKSINENGVTVEIVRVLPDSPAPWLNNIFCNCHESNPSDMLITFDCDAMPVLQVKSYRQKSGKGDTSHYKVTISRFRARMAVAINYNTLKGEMRVEGYPDIRIAMNSVGAIKPMDHDEQQLQEVICEILSTALRDTVYPVDFSVFATCPRADVDPLNLPVIYPGHYDSLAHNMEGYKSNQQKAMISGRRLLVKIVKGEGLKDSKDPYVVIEMDEPAQKSQTGTRQGTEPYWDEHFLFDLSVQTAEILFEVYDWPVSTSDAPKFLGLGLVGIDELAVGPASTQVLVLQPRPYDTQPVAGAITVDFVFIEGAEIPTGPRPYKLKEALRISTPMIDEHMKNGADLADAAVRALKDGALTTNGGQPSKSTLIIHSVQRDISETTNPTASPTDSFPTNEGFVDESTGNASALDEPGDQFGLPNAASSPHSFNKNYEFNGTSNLNNNNNTGSSRLLCNGALQMQTTDIGDTELDERGRSKKRTFFGTLKKRLSRSKTRTHSSERGDAAGRTSTYHNNGTTPPGTLNGHHIGIGHSRRSSISESSAISGFSSASNKTYIHEASTLVLETMENGIQRHFIVPLAIAQRPRWRRKGIKLHIYNDHTFIAKHLSGGGLECTICMNSIPRRPGKQGYECRDCHLICHKHCHVRAPQACPNPTVISMELSKLNSTIADRSIRKV